MKNLYIILFMLFISVNSFGQKETKPQLCATDELMGQLIKDNPEIQQRLSRFDNEISDSENKNENFGTVTIPIAVYIIHEGGPENISDNQVNSQITALNNYFNIYGIKFCLATKIITNPLAGDNQTTPGIIHKNNSELTNHDAQTEQMGLMNIASSVSPENFLRIFIVKSISNTGTDGTTLGYSMLPGVSIDFDGVVIRSDIFGDNTCTGCNFSLLATYDQGKVLVHEIGHYLGLYHTFHEGCSGMNSSTCYLEGDRVCDTPPVATPNYLCESGSNTCSESLPDLPDNINNYMDYGDDNCVNQFSPGQIQRIFNILTNYKRNLTSVENQIYTGTCNFQNLLSASFSASNFAPCKNTSVAFSPLSLGQDINYFWDFGDSISGTNNISTLSNPSHIFTSDSNTPYLITLRITRGTESVISKEYVYVTNCQQITGQNKNWLLSTNNKLNFSTGTPINNGLFPNSNRFGEACAFQNDLNGNLLFYTNNIGIWNASNIQINTNNPLIGNKSTKAGSLIIPNPINPNQYYLFTKDYQNSLGGFRYTLINMNSGIITIDATVNQPINFPNNLGYLTGNDGALYGGEGITAMEKCDGYWIITTLKKSTGYSIIIYSLDTNGLNYHNEFQLPSTIQFYIGSVKISPDGNKLIYVNSLDGIYLFDFNKFNGTISNQRLVGNFGTYGNCFSPDSNLLYVTNNMSEIFQYDLSSNNIQNTKHRIAKEFNLIGEIQRGPDNKLYASIFSRKRLATIHLPNNKITESNPNACLYTTNGPALEASLDLGLPNMIEPKTTTAYNNTVSSTCINCFTYKFAPNVCINSFSWNFGDPASGTNNTSTLSNPTHTFSGYGTYTITLNTGTTSITYSLSINTINPVILGSTTACLEGTQTTNHSVALAVGQNASWSVSGGVINGLNNQSDVTVKWTSLPGTVTLTITNTTGCSTTVTKTITSDCNNQATCDTNLTFNNPQTATANYQASQNINTNTNYTVNNGIDINLKAGNSVVISPNAHIKSGSTFRAHIGSCTEPNTGKQSSKKSVETNLNSISIYPNPTSGIVTIELLNTLMTEITLNSIEGKLVHFKKTANVNYYSLDLNSYEKGIYLLNLKTSEGEFITKKIIKQ